MDKKIGHFAFIAGVIVAILAALVKDMIGPETLAIVLVVLGLIVGFLNITGKETTGFLVAVIALAVGMGLNLGVIPAIGAYLDAIVTNIATFVVPAGIIVALKAIRSYAKD